MTGPLVSVVMPVHDGAAFLGSALDSALGQAGVRVEVLATDDGSRDDSPAILGERAGADPRVRAVSRPHAGIAATRNACLARARGTHVGFLDQDDIWPAGRLARQVARLERLPDAAAVFGTTRTFTRADAAGRPQPDPGRPAVHTILLSAGLFRREALDAVGPFDERYASADDLDLLLRLVESGRRIELEPELGVHHRRHPGQTTADAGATRREFVRALHASLARRRAAGVTGPLRHPLLANLAEVAG